MIVVNKKISSPSVQFNPTFFRRAYKQYKNGYYGELIALMNETYTDSHVFGCLNARRAGFQRPYSLTPFDSENNNDINHTLWLKNVLKNLNMRTLFKHIQSAVLKKFSVIDFTWELLEGFQTPVSLHPVQQKYFKYKDDVLYIDFGRDLMPLPDDALVNEYEDIPVLLPVLRDFILKNFGLESWASFVEVFGEPTIIGYYPSGATPELKQEMEDAVNKIAASSRGIAPEGTRIELIETQRNSGDHDKFVDAADNGISIAILGHENAVSNTKGLQVGENLSSYYAKRDIIIDDSYFIEEQINRLIRTVWDRNFGDARYPNFEIDKSEPVNVSERLELLDLYIRNGGKAKADEFRKLGLDVPEDVEFIEKSLVRGLG